MPCWAGIALIIGLCLVVALLLPVADPHGQRVLAETPDQIIAAHPTHQANNVPCETCHAAAQESRAGSDNLLPGMDVCGQCHEIDNSEKCGDCHTQPQNPAPAQRVTTLVQRFPHAAHIARGMKCEACHGPATAEPQIPSMSSCRGCHETASGLSDCEMCHAESENLHPATHTDGWDSYHATVARVDQAACADCHTETDCQECHAGDNVRPRVHPLNYSYSHALDALNQELACTACHDDMQFCRSCHAAERVLPVSHSRSDWVGKHGGRHAEEAEFDLESCVACHDADSPVCVECHGR